MTFAEVSVRLNPYQAFYEIVIARLSEIGYDSFMEEEENDSLKAYISKEELDEKKLDETLSSIGEGLKYEYQVESLKKENWNLKWETNFHPVEIGKFCRIRAPFHEAKDDFIHELIVEPKMSFGTGHHQTTQLMIMLMENIQFSNKQVLDMGSGTGILAILAAKMKAKEIDAIDIEDWAYENMKENFVRNNCSQIKAYLGDASHIKDRKAQYGIIIANINKNIILTDIVHYNNCLKNSGHLLLSGFLLKDEKEIIAAAEHLGYKKIEILQKDKWLALNFKKKESKTI